MSERIIELGCGMTIREGKATPEIKSFGAEEINALIADGWRVLTVTEPSMMCADGGPGRSEGTQRVIFSGFCSRVTLVRRVQRPENPKIGPRPRSRRRPPAARWEYGLDAGDGPESTPRQEVKP